MNTNIIDALAYTSLPNNISDPSELDNIATNTGIPNPSQISTEQAQEYISNLISNTAIKRACCTARDGIGSGSGVYVRIPAYKYNEGIDPIAKKFEYVDKLIYIPTDMCTGDYAGYKPGSTQCN